MTPYHLVHPESFDPDCASCMGDPVEAAADLTEERIERGLWIGCVIILAFLLLGVAIGWWLRG